MTMQNLTKRQLQIVKMVWGEILPKEIAYQIGIQPKAVRKHFVSAIRAAGCSTREGLYRKAIQEGVLEV